MTVAQAIYNRYKRYRSLQTDYITALPIVILMPHSACNCRCVMCDIWKDNKNLKQLTEQDINGLLVSLKKLGTQKLVISGGEALLNPNFFRFCEIIKPLGIKISLLTTGLLLSKHVDDLLKNVDEIIVSLDGDELVHDSIRSIPGAFGKLRDGIREIRKRQPGFPITARTVIQKANYKSWQNIISAAKEMQLDQISFLPADVSSHAFNREVLWSEQRQHEILPGRSELELLNETVEKIISENANDFENGFIAESKGKLRKIYQYYAAFYGMNSFPYKKCNAPWVSTVVEPDGTVRPCFFHEAVGNIREQSLQGILNNAKSLQFRKNLDMKTNNTCVKCVCYLNLPPGMTLNK